MHTHICGNIINNNDERTHFFRKIYPSHFIRKGCERVVCKRWVGDPTDCNILTPSSSVFSSTSFSFCWAAQLGSWGPKPSAGSWFSLPWTPTNWLQLTRTVCGTGLYNCLTPTCFLWASHLHRIQPVHGQGYILIFSTGCTCFSIDGWFEGQYVTRTWGTLKEKLLIISKDKCQSCFDK